MKAHLACLREFHHALAIAQTAPERLSDMEIVEYQALLLETASEMGKAIKSSEITAMLAAAVDLAYVALAALDKGAGDAVEMPSSWRPGSSVLSVMEAVTDKTGRCVSGEAAAYSELYYLCRYLALSFLNCDFDKAFALRHSHNMDRARKDGESFYSDSLAAWKQKGRNMPEFSECLYE